METVQLPFHKETTHYLNVIHCAQLELDEKNDPIDIVYYQTSFAELHDQLVQAKKKMTLMQKRSDPLRNVNCWKIGKGPAIYPIPLSTLRRQIQDYEAEHDQLMTSYWSTIFYPTRNVSGFFVNKRNEDVTEIGVIALGTWCLSLLGLIGYLVFTSMNSLKKDKKGEIIEVDPENPRHIVQAWLEYIFRENNVNKAKEFSLFMFRHGQKDVRLSPYAEREGTPS